MITIKRAAELTMMEPFNSRAYHKHRMKQTGGESAHTPEALLARHCPPCRRDIAQKTGNDEGNRLCKACGTPTEDGNRATTAASSWTPQQCGAGRGPRRGSTTRFRRTHPAVGMSGVHREAAGHRSGVNGELDTRAGRRPVPMTQIIERVQLRRDAGFGCAHDRPPPTIRQ